MTVWTTIELDTIGAADEVDIAPRRPDGTLGRFVTIWDVRVGDDVFIRSFHGPNGHWYRAMQATGRGVVRVGGLERDVTFEPAADTDSQAVDAGYRAKYGRSSYVEAMVTPTATAATLRVVPIDKEQPCWPKAMAAMTVAKEVFRPNPTPRTNDD